jgi:hypothetical protein
MPGPFVACLPSELEPHALADAVLVLPPVHRSAFEQVKAPTARIGPGAQHGRGRRRVGDANPDPVAVRLHLNGYRRRSVQRGVGEQLAGEQNRDLDQVG